MTCSMTVKEKGIGDGVVRRVIAFIRELGYDGKKLVLKSDQQSLVNAVSVRVAQKREGETFLEHSPARSSGSHGIIERSVKDVHGQIRSMKSAIDERINTDLSGSSNVLCWLVEFAALLISRYSVGHDCKTPYERLKGRKSNMFGFEFGERVLLRRVPVCAKLAKWTHFGTLEFSSGTAPRLDSTWWSLQRERGRLELSADSQKKRDGVAKMWSL